jgi:hypothetical protein
MIETISLNIYLAITNNPITTGILLIALVWVYIAAGKMDKKENN